MIILTIRIMKMMVKVHVHQGCRNIFLFSLNSETSLVPNFNSFLFALQSEHNAKASFEKGNMGIQNIW